MDLGTEPAGDGRGARRHRLRLPATLAACVLTTALAVPPAAQAALPSAREPSTQDEARQREQQALADLAESSAEVRAAAVALTAVAAQLPRAQTDVARARGELAGAKAKLAAANAALADAERAQADAAAQVRTADARVQQSREDVGLLARRTYQRGRLGELRDVVEAGEPQDVLVRAGLLRSVFRNRDARLDRLTDDRLELARTEAGLAAQQRAVSGARARAQEGEARARQISAEAQDAAGRVASLVAARASALRSAEGARAADQADYRQAQAASRALAERIRAAARRAAAEARRKAAAQAAQAAAEAARAAKAAQAARRAPRSTSVPGRSTRRRAAAVPDSGGRTGSMLWPCVGCPLTSTFGWRTHPLFGDRRFHAGIDMGAPLGTPVRSADGGTVTYAGYASGYGTLVLVSHGVVGGRDLTSAYAHMSRLTVSTGQSVARGQQVGLVGNEGNSTGPHLHFEVRRNGDPVDPLSFVSP